MILADSKLMRIPDVSRLLGITTARAYELARNGILPVVRLGRQLRVDPEALRDWLKTGGKALAGRWKREP